MLLLAQELGLGNRYGFIADLWTFGNWCRFLMAHRNPIGTDTDVRYQKNCGPRKKQEKQKKQKTIVQCVSMRNTSYEPIIWAIWHIQLQAELFGFQADVYGDQIIHSMYTQIRYDIYSIQLLPNERYPVLCTYWYPYFFVFYVFPLDPDTHKTFCLLVSHIYSVGPTL